MILVSAAMPAHANIREGLVGWWKMEGTGGTGSQEIDWSGQNHNGTYFSGAAMPASQCKRGGCRFFNRVWSSRLNLGTGFAILTDVTISVWVNPSLNDNTQQIIGRTAGTGQAWALNVIDNTKVSKPPYYGSGGAVLAGSSQLPLNIWSHIVLTIDSSVGAKLYINTVMVANDATITALGNADGTLYIGRGSGYWFDGYIDDVRIYNRAISAQEVSDLYRAGTLIRNAKISNARFNQ